MFETDFYVRMRNRAYLLMGLYFILGLCNSFNAFAIMKDLQAYQLSFAEIGLFMVFPMLPWSFKVVFGIFSDLYPIGGLHRKPYMVISNFFAAIACIILTLPHLTFLQYGFMVFIVQFFTAWFDVEIDACGVEDSRKIESNENRGNIQGRNIAARAVGNLISVSLSAIGYSSLSSSGVYGVLCGFYAVSLVLSMIFPDEPKFVHEKVPITESSTTANTSEVTPIQLTSSGTEINLTDNDVSDSPSTSKNSLCLQLGFLHSFLKDPFMRPLLIFNILVGIVPNASVPLFFFFNDVLKFSTTQFAILSAVGEISRLVGMAIYFLILKPRFSIRTTYICVMFISAFLSYIPLFLSDTVSGCIQSSDAGGGNFTEHVHINFTHYHPQNSTNNPKGICYLFEYFQVDPLGFALSDNVFSEVFDEIRSLPLQVVTSIICVSISEATTYSFNLSIQNLVSGIRKIIEAMCMLLFSLDQDHFESLSSYIIFCASLDLIFAFGAFLLPSLTTTQISSQIREQTKLKSHISFSQNKSSKQDNKGIRGEVDKLEKELRKFHNNFNEIKEKEFSL